LILGYFEQFFLNLRKFPTDGEIKRTKEAPDLKRLEGSGTLCESNGDVSVPILLSGYPQPFLQVFCNNQELTKAHKATLGKNLNIL